MWRCNLITKAHSLTDSLTPLSHVPKAKHIHSAKIKRASPVAEWLRRWTADLMRTCVQVRHRQFFFLNDDGGASHKAWAFKLVWSTKPEGAKRPRMGAQSAKPDGAKQLSWRAGMSAANVGAIHTITSISFWVYMANFWIMSKNDLIHNMNDFINLLF